MRDPRLQVSYLEQCPAQILFILLRLSESLQSDIAEVWEMYQAVSVNIEEIFQNFLFLIYLSNLLFDAILIISGGFAPERK